ncbi:MAG: DUF4388 domain-containing protein [Myxococcota bacterium]
MASAAPIDSRPGSRSRVLVIDDSPTILKVVHAILQRNGFDVTVARDGVEGFQFIEEYGPFDLVLLDFVMPRMNGYQFCRKLRSDPKHRGLPVVLMSARTATIGDRFVEQTGAADALGKPFDARALIAVVQAVLAKQGSEAAPKELPNPDQMVDEEELDARQSMVPASIHTRSLATIRNSVAKAVVPSLLQLSPSDRGDAATLEHAIAAAIDEKVVATVADQLDNLDLQRDSNVVLRGHLNRMPLAEILQTLQLRRQTGVMSIKSQGRSMTLYMREGGLDLATSVGTDDEFRIGRYFVEAGWLTREQVDSELQASRGSGKMFGTWLVEQKLIEEVHLTHVLAKQSAELVYELLRWNDGIFVLSDDEFTETANLAALQLGLSELVLEGFRRVDEWRHMADTIDFDAVLSVDKVAIGTLDDSKISAAERPVLDAIDGERTAREVMEVSEVASFDAIKAIYRLIQSRLVRAARPKPASTQVVDEGTGESSPPKPKASDAPSPA